MVKKKVTLIIPVYNEKNYIYKIIKKINKNFYYDKQIIIVDDCSIDGTREIIKKMKNIDKKIYHKKIWVKGQQLSQLFHM